MALPAFAAVLRRGCCGAPAVQQWIHITGPPGPQQQHTAAGLQPL